jgi:hypothetical protein
LESVPRPPPAHREDSGLSIAFSRRWGRFHPHAAVDAEWGRGFQSSISKWRRSPTEAALLPLEQIGQIRLENVLCYLEAFEKIGCRGPSTMAGNNRPLPLNDEPAPVNVAMRHRDLLVCVI